MSTDSCIDRASKTVWTSPATSGRGDLRSTRVDCLSRCGNGTVLYDVPNRGRIRSPEMNIGGSATAIGDGFLESEGYTLVDSGWEVDLTSGLGINVPVAKNRDGSAITGRVRSEYILDEPA